MLIYDNFTNLLDTLVADSFIQCHPGYIANISYLVSRQNGLMKIEQNDGVFSVNIALLAT